MPKRPQVSVRGEVFARVKQHCEEHGLSIKAFVDDLCTSFFEDASTGKKEAKKKSKKAKKEKKEDKAETACSAGPPQPSKPPDDFVMDDFDAKKARF